MEDKNDNLKTNINIDDANASKKTFVLYEALFDSLYLAFVGEFIAVSIYVQFVYMFEGVYIIQWYSTEIILIIFQLANALSYKFSKTKVKIEHYLYCYLIGVLLSIINISILAIFYTFSNPNLIISLGIVYVALCSGGSLFHCYVKYIYPIYVITLMSVFSYVSFMVKDSVPYLYVGPLIYMVAMAIAGIVLNNFISKSYALSKNNAESLLRIDSHKKKLHLEQVKAISELEKVKYLERDLVHLNDSLVKARNNYSNINTKNVKLFDSIVDSIDYGIIITAANGQVLSYNGKLNKYIKNSRAHQEKNLITAVIDLFHDNAFFNSYFPYSSDISQDNKKFILTNRALITIECILRVINHDNKTVNLWVFNDITEKVRANKEVILLAYYDSLTGLPNRTMIYSKIKQYIAQAKSNNTLCAFVFIDLDDFKVYNDTMGHALGNDILIQMANKLSKTIRKNDFIGRLGGDEFICIFSDLVYKSDVDQLVEKLLNAVTTTITINRKKFVISASIGVSYYPCDTEDANKLISFADIAMYQAKSEGKSSYQRFLPKYNSEFQLTHESIQCLKRAKFDEEFYLIYQPIYDFSSKKITKVEALLRWNKNIDPDIFIPLAEKIGVIHDLGLWVVKNAIRACILANRISDKDIKVSINISKEQIRNKSQIRYLLDFIKNSNCNPKLLEFELIEHSFIDYNKAAFFVDEAKKLGISLAIDNFGTGLSCLSYLKEINFDTIKIDKDFIKNIISDQNEVKVFNAIFNLSETFGSKLSVVGIETKEQFDYFAQNSCDFGQGFYIGKPMLLDNLVDKIKSKQ
jgi:diguanylate cyclase (GGDEF)-like protein